MAEIKAIHRACEIIHSNSLWCGRNVIISSDSKTMVSWINSEDFGSLNHVHLIYDIRSWLKVLGNASVIFDPRSTNSFVDMLAKRGATVQVMWVTLRNFLRADAFPLFLFSVVFISFLGLVLLCVFGLLGGLLFSACCLCAFGCAFWRLACSRP
ncbi:hypothetical protein Q3G72_005585 [Acer saccharum]|nr:hypothetical protein Q3G72_005585 [Acer saccharum]